MGLQQKQELRVFRMVTLLPGIAFKGKHISFLVSLAFAVAASANCWLVSILDRRSNDLQAFEEMSARM